MPTTKGNVDDGRAGVDHPPVHGASAGLGDHVDRVGDHGASERLGVLAIEGGVEHQLDTPRMVPAHDLAVAHQVVVGVGEQRVRLALGAVGEVQPVLVADGSVATRTCDVIDEREHVCTVGLSQAGVHVDADHGVEVTGACPTALRWGGNT